ncbi:hypothetical protein ACFL6N_02050 [Thermodesulfobacteriota bacterium]
MNIKAFNTSRKPRPITPHIRVCIFSTALAEKGQELQETLRSEIHNHLELYLNIDFFTFQLRENTSEPKVVILQPGNRNDLSQLLTLKELLDIYPLILLLPDEDAKTIALGHRLWPRFVTTTNNYHQVAAVLKKIVTRIQITRGDSETLIHNQTV